MRRREQGLTVYTGLMWLIGTLVVIQLWLVAAALDALLGGHREVLIPAALLSFVLFLVNGALVLFVMRLDRHIRRGTGPPE